MESEEMKKLFENNFFILNKVAIEIIRNLFYENLPYFRKNKIEDLGMFFNLEYQYKNYVIYFGGDRGDLVYSLKTKDNGNVSNVLVTPFQTQIATFSVKNVIFQEILRLNNIESNSLNQSKWLRWHAHVPNMLVKI